MNELHELSLTFVSISSRCAERRTIAASVMKLRSNG
jgi:hypothetical protein